MKNQYYQEYRNKPRQVVLKGIGFLGHYAFVIVLFLPFLLTLIDYIRNIIGIYQGSRSIQDLFLGTGLFALLALLLFLFQYNRLRFYVIKSDFPPETIIEICYNIGIDNNWTIKQQSKNVFIATSKGDFSLGLWGEMITVISKDNRVYLNSICDPYRMPNILSYGKNRLFINEIVKQIKIASA